MKYTIKAPRQLNASINLPASKSISNRALAVSYTHLTLPTT